MQGQTTTYKTIQKSFVPPNFDFPSSGSYFVTPIGGKEVPELNPFGFLFYYDLKVPFSTSDHPHIGMETVTYMIDGQIDYEDFHGHVGAMEPGHVQWMTAGKGLVHAEKPHSVDKPATGFQLFMNLPSEHKFCDPEYQEFPKGTLPETMKDGIKVKVLAGETLRVKSPVYQRNPSLILDLEIPANSKFEQVIPRGWNVFTFVHVGKAWFGEGKEEAGIRTAVMFNQNQDDDEVILIETREETAHVFLAAGQPCGDFVRHNSLFMDTQEGIEKAKDDYANAREGFVDAKGWESNIKKFITEFKKNQEAQGSGQTMCNKDEPQAC